MPNCSLRKFIKATYDEDALEDAPFVYGAFGLALGEALLRPRKAVPLFEHLLPLFAPPLPEDDIDDYSDKRAKSAILCAMLRHIAGQWPINLPAPEHTDDRRPYMPIINDDHLPSNALHRLAVLWIGQGQSPQLKLADANENLTKNDQVEKVFADEGTVDGPLAQLRPMALAGTVGKWLEQQESAVGHTADTVPIIDLTFVRNMVGT